MRVPDEVKECVGFLGIKRNGKYSYRGTCFFVAIPYENNEHSDCSHLYIVTARHCVENATNLGDDLCLRLNTNDGESEVIQLGSDWIFPENGDETIDVAVMPFNQEIEKYTVRAIPRKMFADDEKINHNMIGMGDELFITGLFTERTGRKRNIPIVRGGIIASMSDEKLEDKKTGFEYSAYLAEVRSIGGLSGSPVFVHLTRRNRDPVGWTFFFDTFLLGLIRGHWDTEKRETTESSSEEDLSYVNMGIAIVTPIREILSIINGDELARRRRKIEKDFQPQFLSPISN